VLDRAIGKDGDFASDEEPSSSSEADAGDGDIGVGLSAQGGFYPTRLPFRGKSSNGQLDSPGLFEKESARDIPMLLQDDPPVDPFNAGSLGLGGTSPSTVSPEEDRLYFVQLPTILPISGSELAGRVPVEDTKDGVDDMHARTNGSCLSGVPGGKLGKLLVYKSGAVKMKVGDVILDVQAGSKCSSDQSLLYLDTSQKNAFNLGQVNQRMIITPDPTLLLH